MQSLIGQETEIDPLTGFYSRQGLLSSAEKELNKTDGFAKPLSLIYLNLQDYSKFVKDQGEREGNSLLLFVSNCIRKGIKKTVLIGRLHADEFVILLPGVHPDRAMTLLHRLRRRLKGELQKSNYDVEACIGGITYLTYPASMEKMLQNLEEILHNLKKCRSSK